MIRQTSIRSSILTIVVYAVLLGIAAAGCAEPDDPGTLKANRTPETRLSNVPPPGTVSTSPLVSLSWLGDDADGYVVAYRYSWTFQQCDTCEVERKDPTYILNIMIGGLALIMDGTEASAPDVYKYFSTLPPEGLDTASLNALARGDTLQFAGVPVWASNPDGERYPEHESPSRGTFIFDSQDSLNPHIFDVAAIDNNGAVDPSPATVDFTTPLVSPPDVEIVAGPGSLNRRTQTFGDTVIILNEFTDTYDGIEFSFQGYDPNSRTIEYSWIVDRDEWHPDSVESRWSPFSLTPNARIKGSDMPDPYKPNHTIYLRGRNEFGSISTRGYFTRPSTDSLGNAIQDTTWAHANFSTVYPEFAKPGAPQRILLINNTFDWDTLAVPPIKPARSALLQYYAEMYDALGLTGKYDVYNVSYNSSLQGTWPGLGLIGQYSLVHVVGDVTNDFNRIPSISPGHQGKLTEFCYAGGKVLINGWNMTRADNMQQSANFWNNILHILTQNAVTASQYVGATNQVIPDSGGQYPDAPLDQAKLDSAWAGAMPAFHFYQAYGFGEIIYRFDSKDDLVFLENTVVGIRYIGLTYDVIYLGFPLYYTEQPAAIEVLRKAFRDLKHL